MSKSSKDWGGYLTFFLLGAATGAAIALLFAPQEGEETRKLLSQKANELKDKAANLKEKASDYSTEVTKSAKERWGTLVENVSAKAQEVKETVTAKAQEVKNQLQTAVVKDGKQTSPEDATAEGAAEPAQES